MKLIQIQVFVLILFCFCIKINRSKSLIGLQSGIRSDAIVTQGFGMGTHKIQDPELTEEEQEKPGWIRRQLLRFGEMTSAVGNKLGGFSSSLAKALDKICEIVKTIIPVIAAVCHVGQFEFCGAINEGPQELANALAPSNIDLSIQD